MESEPAAKGRDGGDKRDDGGADFGEALPSAVKVTINATEDDLHTINTALAGLRRITTPGRMRIRVEAEAQSIDGPIDKIKFQNSVRQHLEEDEDVEFEENWQVDGF